MSDRRTEGQKDTSVREPQSRSQVTGATIENPFLLDTSVTQLQLSGVWHERPLHGSIACIGGAWSSHARWSTEESFMLPIELILHRQQHAMTQFIADG